MHKPQFQFDICTYVEFLFSLKHPGFLKAECQALEVRVVRTRREDGHPRAARASGCSWNLDE